MSEQRAYSLDELPEGSMPVPAFAKTCGVRVAIAENHRNWGLTNKNTGALENIETTLVRSGKRLYHYLTPDQQRRALEFWDKHNVPHSKPKNIPIEHSLL